MRVLLAEDERDLNAIITQKLMEENFSVDSCFDGEDAVCYYSSTEYDVIILDIMMPKRDGFSVLSEIRKRGDRVPVLILTARDAISDRVKGLDSGANDYLVKPFSLEELIARVRALTRQYYGVPENRLVVDDLIMDLSSHEVTRGGRRIDLSGKEYQMLEYLMYNRGRVLTRQQIENHIWNYDYEGGTNVVDVYIRYLRRKIEIGTETKLIRTVRGTGYVMKAE